MKCVKFVFSSYRWKDFVGTIEAIAIKASFLIKVKYT
jgi:hypothetical protein